MCRSDEMETIFTWKGLPTFCNVLHETREQALRTERAVMQLVSCLQCGFIHNAAFEPEKVHYGPHYGNPLSASPHFCRYATGIAEELIQRYRLHDQEIIEIGCGDGYFLGLLCDIGRNRGIGFDPSYDPHGALPDRDASDVRIVADTYSQRHAQYHPAMVCCRHVLEHIHDPLGFLLELRRTLDAQKECIVFFEVPDARHTFLRGAVWDILYEHCNYFTSESLRWVFERAGFQVIRIDERYASQFLTIEARPSSVTKEHEGQTGEPTNMQNQLADFQSLFRDIVNSWQARIAAWQEHCRRIVLWGAGTKGVTLLNVLGLSHERLEHVVDVHPGKQGKFVPGTGQEIIAPESLAVHQPDTVVVMNPLYLQEIRDMARRYTKTVTFVAASDPRRALPVACDVGRAEPASVLNESAREGTCQSEAFRSRGRRR